jgi:hypothetical protein
MATSHHCLIWRADRQRYELDEQGRKQFFPRTRDEGDWVTWLESISAFSFQRIPPRIILLTGKKMRTKSALPHE